MTSDNELRIEHTTRRVIELEGMAPISLNTSQERAVKEWAADDRLWTTQETVEFNLRTFASRIISGAKPDPDNVAILANEQHLDMLIAWLLYASVHAEYPAQRKQALDFASGLTQLRKGVFGK